MTMSNITSLRNSHFRSHKSWHRYGTVLHWVALLERPRCPLGWCRLLTRHKPLRYLREGCQDPCTRRPPCSWMRSRTGTFLEERHTIFSPDNFACATTKHLTLPHRSRCPGGQHWPPRPGFSSGLRELHHTWNRHHLWPEALSSRRNPVNDITMMRYVQLTVSAVWRCSTDLQFLQFTLYVHFKSRVHRLILLHKIFHSLGVKTRLKSNLI